MRNYIQIILFVTSLCLLFTCCDKDRVLSQEDLPVVTVVFYDNGLGDFGYQDNIYSGICQLFYKSKFAGKFRLEIYTPDDSIMGDRILDEWFKKEKSCRELLVVTANQVASSFKNNPEWVSRPGAEVLIMDSNDASLNVNTRIVTLYGSSFLAGLLVKSAGLNKAAVIAANNVYPAVQEGVEGFVDGFRELGGQIGDESIFYLAESSLDGFAMPNEAFNLSHELSNQKYQFIFPICGGSSHGVFRYARQYESGNTESSPFYTCGMDVDQQSMTGDIIFSVVKKYDDLLEDYIGSWLEGKHNEEHLTLMLDSEYSDVEIANKYKDYVSADEFLRLNAIAFEAEKAYYSK